MTDPTMTAPTATACRTCSACRQSRIKCSNGPSCERCVSKGLTCHYPSRKREEISVYEPEGPDTVEGPVGGNEISFPLVNDEILFETSLHSLPDTLYASTNSVGDLQDHDRWMSTAHEDQNGLNQPGNTVTVSHNNGLQNFSVDVNGDSTSNELMDMAWTNSLPFDYNIDFDFASAGVPSLDLDQPPQTQQEMQPRSKLPKQSPIVAQRDEIVNDHRTLTSSPSRLAQIGTNSTLQHRSRSKNQPRPKSNLYLAGSGARIARSGRPTFRISGSNAELAHSPTITVISDGCNDVPLDEAMSQHAHQIGMALPSQRFPIGPLYNEKASQASWHPFSADRFPTMRAMEYYMCLYFDHFDRMYPFVDRRAMLDHWQLSLAIMATGARYASWFLADASSDALHGLLYGLSLVEVRFRS
jgi:hypothetical protein